MGTFNPSDTFRVLLVDPNENPYSLSGIFAMGSFNPSDTARVVLVDPDGNPYKATGGSGGGATIQVNGVDTSDQTLLNFVDTASVTWTNPSGGIVEATATGGGGTGTVTQVNTTAPITGGPITTTGTIGITQASASVNGFLSSTDWNTFNNKQPAGSYLTSVTADSPLSGSGTSGSHLVIADAAADGITKGAATFTASDFNAAAGVISLDYANGQKASASVPGFLSSTDWSTFNGKQAAGNYITALTSDVTASGPGSATATIANQAVTLAKIQNAAASSKLLGSGATGAGSSYAELTLGTNLSMSGTTLNATGGGGTPGGSNTQVQFNDSSAFGGDSGFTYDKTTNTASVDSAIFKVSPWVDVRAFGATGDGTTDDTTAIQNAIDSLPAKGGTVFFPVPTSFYKITATLTVGDGSTSAVSTKTGIILQGGGMPVAPVNFTGYPATGGTTIKWINATGAPMISIKGPLQGWGVNNLQLLGNGQATGGLLVTSAQYGDCRNLSIQDIDGPSIKSTTVPTFTGVSNTDSLHNRYSNIYILLSKLNSFGILCQSDGAGTVTSNTDYNIFDNFFIQATPTNQNVFFIYLQVCDSNKFNQGHLSGATASNIVLTMDYSINTGFPTGNQFQAMDWGGVAAVFQNAGSPAADRRNLVYALDFSNGATSNPSLSGLLWGFTASDP